MLAALFPIVFAGIFAFLLVQAFFMMSLGFNVTGSSWSSEVQDRTGLLTVHPELFDQNGEITSEDLFVLKFSEFGESDGTPA